MPSYCLSCNRIKKSGSKVISFHKFPLNNEDVLKSWSDFLKQDAKYSGKPLNLNKFSSLCSLHFTKEDFAFNGAHRRYLKKDAVPSLKAAKERIVETEEEIDETSEISEQNTLLSDSDENCGLCMSFNQNASENLMENYFELITKCLPNLNINLENLLNKKICQNCVNTLNQFSKFMDKVLIAHSNLEFTSISSPSSYFVQKPLQIKKEPDPVQDEDENDGDECFVVPHVSERKCEILEIVDIKPDLSFDFMSGFNSNSLKVELNNDDEELEYEMEPIIYVSHDHNYHILELKDESEDINSSNTTKSKIPKKSCNKCNKKFVSTKFLLIHKQRHHPIVKISKIMKKSLKKFKSSLKCVKCRRYFKDQKGLRKHKLTDCRKIKDEISSNIQETSKVQDAKNHTCEICQKSFSGYRNLYQHKKGHSTESFPCNMCKSVFKRKNGLTQHYKSVHLKIKPHQCPVCQKDYFFKTDMMRCKHSKWSKKS